MLMLINNKFIYCVTFAFFTFAGLETPKFPFEIFPFLVRLSPRPMIEIYFIVYQSDKVNKISIITNAFLARLVRIIKEMSKKRLVGKFKKAYFCPCYY